MSMIRVNKNHHIKHITKSLRKMGIHLLCSLRIVLQEIRTQCFKLVYTMIIEQWSRINSNMSVGKHLQVAKTAKG